jgi:hypothetical protein
LTVYDVVGLPGKVNFDQAFPLNRDELIFGFDSVTIGQQLAFVA